MTKIAITGDNHLDFLHNAESNVQCMLEDMVTNGYTEGDPIINLGDITNGRLYERYRGLEKVLQKHTFYVLGNHDLWSPKFDTNRKPDEAFDWMIKWLSEYPAIPLEKSFLDVETVCQDAQEKYCIVGTMGFPDFEHPILVYPKRTYEKRHCTNDGRYIDLSKGWLIYTNVMLESFEKRLQKAISLCNKHVIVATHYPIFESQYKLSRDDISAYFFCYRLGETIRRYAKDNPNKTFWCFTAHAHEYCRGKLFAETDNLAAMGVEGAYGSLAYAIIDLEAGVNQDVLTHWIPKPCAMIIETRETI